MTTGAWGFAIFWFLMAFLFVLNLYLQGSWRQQIEVILGLLTFAVGLASFFIFGWRFGALMVILWFPFAWISRPIASRIVFLLLGYRTGVHERPDYHVASQHLMSGNIQEALRVFQKQEEELNRRLEAVGRRLKVAAILAKHSLNLSDLRELHQILERCGLSDLAWNILSNPADLEELIKFNQGPGDRESMTEFAARIRQLK